MGVFPLLLGREENGVILSTPLLLREMNAGRRCRMKHWTVSLILFLSPRSLSRLPAFGRWPDLTRKLTEQAKDDCAWIVHMDWTYREKTRAENASKDVFSNLQRYINL